MSILSDPPRPSPCIGVCKLDEGTGYCLGCGRTGDEIAAWGSLSPAGQDAVWLSLPARLEALSVRLRLLPLMGGDLAAWIAERIREGRGRWVVGVPGAVAAFPCQGSDVEVAHDGGTVTAAAKNTRFRLRLAEKLRAFAVGRGGLVLGILRGRAAFPLAKTFTALGEDEDAIVPGDRGDALFDFGIGRPAHRFCVRSGDAALIERLLAHAGRPWSEVMATLGSKIAEHGPAKIVESAAARIEVLSKMSPPGGEPPAGSYACIVPKLLERGKDMPQGLSLPEHASPVAIFYPGGVAGEGD